jgi:hypothetical protein
MKRKSCDIRTWKRRLFLDISSSNTDTLVASLYQCVETRSIEVFWLLSQPLPHLVEHHLRLSNVPVVNRFTPQTRPLVNKKHFYMNFLCNESFCPTKIAQQNAALRHYTPQTWSPFLLLKPASEHEHARLLPRPSWSWTVLLPSDTHRKPIASITAVSLQFVTCLLILPRIW